jgi:glycosyltransferase involved in cell wall biosynthesis
MSDVQVSIVAACRNEIGHIQAFLDSIQSQEMGGLTWEAIVADGESTDGTREFLDSYCASHDNVRVISNPGRIVSTGLNAAIRASRGEFILRMDAHTFYAADYCRQSVETLLSTGADNVGGPARTRVRGTVAKAIAAAYHSRFSTGGAPFHRPDYEGWADTVPYGCWRKSTLERLGLFDETLVRNQDDELNLRLLRSGGRIWQNPAIISWYSPRASLSSLFNQYFQYGFWKVPVIAKHRRPGSWRHLVPSGFVAMNVLMPIGTAAAVMTGAGSVATAALVLWLGTLAAYTAALIVASGLAARTHGWKTLPYLPAVFCVFHVSYGSGFLAGLLWFRRSVPVTVPGDSFLVRITR